MPDSPTQGEVDQLLEEVFMSTSLPFIQRFMRELRASTPRIRIGGTRAETRSNLREALLAKRVGLDEVAAWLSTTEGWGKQHLYVAQVPKRTLAAHSHLLSKTALDGFLRRRGLLSGEGSNGPEISHVLRPSEVDDELARLVWRSASISRQRDPSKDETRDIDGEEYEFHAYRCTARRSAARLVVRKTDGVVVVLVDLPQGDALHKDLFAEVYRVAQVVLAPLTVSVVSLSSVVAALDESGVSQFGPRATRPVDMAVAATQTRFGAEGGTIEFRSRSDGSSYTGSEEVRRVRKKLQVEKFAGEVGKYRLTFDTDAAQPHEMVVSFDASANRAYLFSRMSEVEVMKLVDYIASAAVR